MNDRRGREARVQSRSTPHRTATQSTDNTYSDGRAHERCRVRSLRAGDGLSSDGKRRRKLTNGVAVQKAEETTTTTANESQSVCSVLLQ